MGGLPSGTVTFLFTDLEGSTRLWEQDREAMADAVARHDALLEEAIGRHGGVVFSRMGDGMAAAFGSAPSAVTAAVDAQSALSCEPWGLTGPLRARMGVHTGEGRVVGDQYESHTLNRCARLMAIAHGGQLVISGATAALVNGQLPERVELIDLGDHRLRDLRSSMHVFQVDAPGLGSEFPPLRTVEGLPGNLPPQLSSFIGRDDEVDHLAALLQEERVVTLTGVGGVGKTRLALQAAGELLPHFRDGAWIIELASLRDAGAVPEAFAAAFGVTAAAGTRLVDALSQSLRAKELLLVVDNCEHLLGPAAELVRHLTQTCPELTVLATSREGLGIAGERLVGVASLGLPASIDHGAVMASDAGRLFVDRAVAVKSDFEATGAIAPAIGEIVRRLDGIPLAIELAAARVAVLSPAQIAQRLDQRFRLLAGGERGAIERHATLRATVDWSFDLLSHREQLLLTRLSVFAGGCTLEAAEQVCSNDEGGAISEVDVLDLLSVLVARSLVVADDTDPTAHRYRLLETIRQYAEERLDPGERDRVRDRHARCYTEFLETALVGARSPEPHPWLQRVEIELENVRTAVAGAVAAGDMTLMLQLFGAIEVPLVFLPVAGAVYSFADDVLGLARQSDDPHPEAFVIAAWLAAIDGDAVRAEELLAEMPTISEPSLRLQDWTCGARMAIANARGDWSTALEFMLSGTEAAARDPYNQAWQLATMAAARATLDDTLRATADAERAVALARAVGSPLLTAYALGQLALAVALSEPVRARLLLTERTALQHSIGERYVDDVNLVMTVVVGTLVDERDLALRAGSLILDRAIASPLILVTVLEGAASSIADDAPDDAALLHGVVDSQIPGLSSWGPFVELRQRTDARIKSALDPTHIEQQQERGAAMTLDDACAYTAALIERALARR
jgi:predicted ATPase/class 3 adenylate cyclase